MATPVETKPHPSLPATDHSINSEENPASFFCRHCQSAYRQPKILKCLHSFCSQCLQEVLDKTPGVKALACPLCSCLTTVPSGGVEEMTSNSFLQRISNDYVKEVKNTLASKSLREGSSDGRQEDSQNYNVKSVATPGIKSTFHDELQQHRFTNLTDEQKSKTSLVVDSNGNSGSSSTTNIANQNETAKTDTGSSEKVNVHDSIQNMNRLQAKSMGLQGEALRVTYAIDHVNNHKDEWLQRREDLKRAIQRRSAQFQSAVKKMERHLISQIEDKNVEDKFHNSLDAGKTELRKNLKQVLHEVSVIKSVREMGNYAEINELSSSLLGPSVGVGEVILDDLKYQLDLPTKSIDEMVRVGFGNLITTHEKKSVYAPDLKDYASLSLAEITNVEEKSHSMAFKTGGIMSAISGDSRIKSPSNRSASVVGRQARRRCSDVGQFPGKTDAMLEEFQNARESLRNRRQEILRQGSRDASPWRGGGGGVAVSVRRVSRPTARRGRVQVQSLDRSSSVREEDNLLSKAKTNSHNVVEEDESHPFLSSVEVYSKSAAGQTNYKADDTTMPSPIIEEAIPSQAVSKMETTPILQRGMSSPVTSHRQRTISASSNDMGTSEKAAFQDLSKANRGQHSSSSSTSSSRRVSFDMSPAMSPTSEYFPVELFGKNIENSRQLRKAITGAADKKAKIEFLRENWQRRKEILIQTRGFVSSEESSSTSKPDTSLVSALVSDPGTSPENGTTKFENSTYTEIPLASRGIGSPPLRSKFTSVRKTQINEKRYQGSPDASRSPSTSGDSPSLVRKTEIPASVLDKELRKIEATNASHGNVQSFTTRKLSNPILVSNFDKADAKDEAKSEDEDEEEEETVVLTETISVPFTSELLQDVKSPQKEVKMPSTIKTETSPMIKTNFQKSSSKADEEQEEKTVFEDTVTVSLPRVTTRSSVSSLYSSSTRKVDPIPPSTVIKDSATTSSTRIIPTDKISGPTIPSTTTNVKTDISRFQASTSSSAYVKSDTTDSKRTNSTTEERAASFVRRNANEQENTVTSSKPSTSSFTPEPEKVQTTSSKVTNTTTAASTLSTTTNRATLSSTSQFSTTTTTTTSTSTSSSTASSYSYRRYVPKTETIDVAALFSSFYKTPSSATSTNDRDAKSKNSEDNKENVDGKGTSTVLKTQTRVETTSSYLLNNKTNTNTATAKTEQKEEITNSTSKNEIANSATQSRYGSTFLRNYHSSTESRYAAQNTPVTEIGKTPETKVPITQASRSQISTDSKTPVHSSTLVNINKESEASKSISVPNTAQTSTNYTSSTSSHTTTATTTKTTRTTNSLYSKYYSNPNTLYSKPPDTKATPKPNDNDGQPTSSSSSPRQTSHDKKVQETFTQAESARRVYEPPTSTPSENRRHTADISKTIPKGIKISELYSKPTIAQENSAAETNVSKSSTRESTTTLQETENILTKPQQRTHSLYQPSAYYSAQSSGSISKLTHAETSEQQRQQSTPGTLDFKSKTSETKQQQIDEQQKQPKLTPSPGQKTMSLSFSQNDHRLFSSASSPASSPLIEDKELFTDSEQFGDSTGGMSSSSSSRNLKEIARKKRERWRRLTVY